jgi:phosphonate transport system permease protein
MNSHSLTHTPDRWQWTAARPQGKGGWLAMPRWPWSLPGCCMERCGRADELERAGGRHAADWRLFSRSVPPDWSMLPRLWAPALETIQIAIWGTFAQRDPGAATVLVAAGNLHGWHWLRRITRQFLNVIRSINELILALVFVSAVGLGPFPGVLALALHGMGMLAKFFAEAIEEIDDGPLQALRSAGASQLQIIAFGVVPQVITAWIAVVLYRFEVNLRSATVLGMVGRAVWASSWSAASSCSATRRPRPASSSSR